MFVSIITELRNVVLTRITKRTRLDGGRGPVIRLLEIVRLIAIGLIIMILELKRQIAHCVIQAKEVIILTGHESDHIDVKAILGWLETIESLLL